MARSVPESSACWNTWPLSLGTGQTPPAADGHRASAGGAERDRQSDSRGAKSRLLAGAGVRVIALATPDLVAMRADSTGSAE
jgi:hypothetical protein